MVDPLAAFSPPRQRLSLQALVTVGVLHVAFLWMLLQSAPAEKLARQVVIQYFSPITPLREKIAPQPVRAVTPEPKLLPVAPPPPPLRVEPTPPVEQAPVPVIQRMEAVTAQRATVKIQEIRPQMDTRRVPELSSARIEPVLAPVPVLPTPEPLPPPKPIPEPVPPALQTPPAAPVPEPVVAPLPVPAAPSAAVPVPVPAQSPAPLPTAAPARAAAITPVESQVAPASAGGTGGVGAAQPVPGVAPGGSGLNLNFSYKPESRGRQKTAAEMANEQLNGTARRDKLAEGVNAAEKPDCVNSGQALGLLAPIAIAYNVVKDKCK